MYCRLGRGAGRYSAAKGAFYKNEHADIKKIASNHYIAIGFNAEELNIS